MRLPLLSSLLSHVIEHRPVQSDCRTHHVISIWSRIIFVAHYLIFLPIFLSDYKYNISIIVGTFQWTYTWCSEWSRFWLVSESIKAAHCTTSSLMTFTSLRSNRPVSFDSIWISFQGGKRGRVFPMVILPAFRMGQYSVNDHPYHAPQFILLICSSGFYGVHFGTINLFFRWKPYP